MGFPPIGRTGSPTPKDIATVGGNDASNNLAPLQVDSSGNLKVAVTGAGSGGTSSVDKSSFSAGTSAGTPVMAVVNPGDSPPDGDLVIIGAQTNRSLNVYVTGQAGGGSAVSIADGADVAEGATTDSAVTGDNSGTVNAHLRGLTTIAADEWDSTNHGVKAIVQNSTLAVTQSGTWNVTNVSGTVSLPTGASTAAKQPALGTAGTPSADVISIQGVASGTVVPISDGGGSITVDGTVAATQSGTWNITNVSGTVSLPTSASTSTKQSDGSQKTQIVDGSGNVIASTSNALNVAITAGGGSGGTASSFGATFPATGTAAGAIDSGGNMAGLTLDASGYLKVNVAAGGGAGGTSSSFGSAVPATGTAAGFSDGTNMQSPRVFDADSGGGTQYVLGVNLRTIASGGSVPVDGTTPLQVSLANTGSNSNKLLVTPDANSAVNIAQMNGVTTTMGNGVSGTGVQRVTLASDSTGIIALTTGSAQIGHLEANQSVNIAQMNGVTTTMGNGVAGTGVQRVTIASDSTGTVAATQSGTWTVQPGNTANTTAWLVTNQSTGKTVSSAGGSASASGNNTLVAAGGGSNKIKVKAFSLTTTSTTAMTCIFQSGASGTELWRVILQAPTGANAGANLAVAAPDWLFATAANTLLNLNLSSANAVHWSVSYVTEA